jgi:inorganic pyrophosphatase
MLTNRPAFIDRSRQMFRVVVESPRHSNVKFKFDPDLGVMTVGRPLALGLRYPFDWGFIPRTKMSDGDPLDAMVFWDGLSYPGVVIACRALAVLEIEQNKKDQSGRERNDRVIAVPFEAPRESSMRALSDLSSRVRKEIEQFFVQSTVFEHKALKILGWRGADAALELIREAAKGRGRRKR